MPIDGDVYDSVPNLRPAGMPGKHCFEQEPPKMGALLSPPAPPSKQHLQPVPNLRRLPGRAGTFIVCWFTKIIGPRDRAPNSGEESHATLSY